MERFVILSIPRSGSTLLVRTLDNHPYIFCAGELFNTSSDMHHPEYHFKSWGIHSKNHTVQRINRIINYPNHRLNARPHIKSFYKDHGPAEEARGFKLMYANIHTAPYLWNYIRDEHIKVIVLIRKNVFKIALSRYRKATNRVAHITTENAPAVTFHVPAQMLIQQMKELEKINTLLLQCTQNMPRLIIHYEDFFQWQQTMQQVQEFLGVQQVALPQALKKIGAGNWQHEVTNAEEVYQLLQQNHLAHYAV